MRTTRLTLTCMAVLALVFSVTRMWCQGIVTGSITGTVQDPSGALIQNATVTAVQAGTNSTTTIKTGSTGAFLFPGLPIGAYTLKIEAPGFVGEKIENVLVQTGSATPLGTVSLTIGTSEAVTVEAATALLQPDSVQISQEFDTQKTANLPIGNGFDIVALLTPGVAPSGGNVFTNNNGAAF